MNRKVLTEEQIEYAVKNLNTKSIKSIANDLGISKRTLNRGLFDLWIIGKDRDKDKPFGLCEWCKTPLESIGRFCCPACSSKALQKRPGYVCSFKDPEVRKKIKATNLERYGGENPMDSEEVRAKAVSTSLIRYGTENPASSKVVKEKIKNTFVSKYGATSPWLNEEFSKKKIDERVAKTGYAYPFSNPQVQEKVKETFRDRYGVDYLGGDPRFLEKIKETTKTHYGVDWGVLTDQCIESQGKVISKINQKMGDMLPGCSFEEKIGNSSFDLRYGDLLIEVNPSYTHNSTRGPKFGNYVGKPKNPDYHYNKSKLANDHGFECIHIWDWDEVDKVIRVIKSNSGVIYARQCEIKIVNKDVANRFLDKYHLQGACRGQTVRLGLFRKGELVQLMTFGRPRYNKNFQFELLRLCSSYKVVGGAEKLFKYFINTYSPISIVSYCDLSKFSGKVYEKLGFTGKLSKPHKHWYNIKTGRHILHSLLLQRGADQLLGTNYGKGTDNESIMLGEGYVCIYDCGQKVFKWKS